MMAQRWPAWIRHLRGATMAAMVPAAAVASSWPLGPRCALWRSRSHPVLPKCGLSHLPWLQPIQAPLPMPASLPFQPPLPIQFLLPNDFLCLDGAVSGKLMGSGSFGLGPGSTTGVGGHLT